MSLSTSQRDVLEQLLAVTSSSTTAARERDERLLRENGWNVQATVEQIFSMGASDTPAVESDMASSSSIASGPARLEVEEPLLPRQPVGARRLSGSNPNRSPRSPGGPANVGLGSGIWGVLTFPVSLIASIVGGVWYFVIRNFVPLSLLPRLPTFLLPPTTPGSSSRPRPAQDPTTNSLRFIRDLETFTRGSSAHGTLPDFYIGPYREFVQSLRSEGKLGLVILVCSEHEDDEEFKRDVLSDPELVRTFKEKEVVVWAADVASREGYQVSQTLLTTTYPSLTFLSLLPVPNSSTPKLAILSNLAGPPSTITSTTSIIQALTTTILPRVTPFLNRLKRERLSLEEARHLRAEQDRAFRDAERRDRERMQAQRQKEELERIQKERAEREAQAKANAVENRKVWRRYARKHLLPPAGGPVRVAIRTPLSSDRHIRQFNPGPSTLPLFIYVETLLIPGDQGPESDPDTPPEGYEHTYDFSLVTSFPRKEIDPTEVAGEEVWDLVQKGGGALFAEKKEGSTWGQVEGDEDSDEEVIED
ncbi:hypothetical protein IAU60_006062 [Kwoniella sp. DSM 27419]